MNFATVAEERLRGYLGGDAGARPDGAEEVFLLMRLDRLWRSSNVDGADAAAALNRLQWVPSIRNGWNVLATGTSAAIRLRHSLRADSLATELTQRTSDSAARPGSIDWTQEGRLNALDVLVRFHFWCCAVEIRAENTPRTYADTLRERAQFAAFVDELFHDQRATATALELVLPGGEDVHMAAPVPCAGGIARFARAVEEFRRVDGVHRRQRSYVRSAEVIARAGQSCGKKMRAAGFDVETAEEGARIDLEDVALDLKDEPHRRSGEAHTDARWDEIQTIRTSVLAEPAAFGPALVEHAHHIRELLWSLRVAQITGFVRNPIGKDDQQQRAYRQIEDQISVPFTFPRPDGELKELPQSSERQAERARERLFLDTLHVRWPARRGVDKAGLRKLFAPAGDLTMKGSEPAVFITDGEITFYFFLAVIAVALAAGEEHFEPWLAGERKLPTLFCPSAPPDSTAAEAWLAEPFWQPGTFRDLIAQAGLVLDGKTTARFHSLLDFVTEADPTAHTGDTLLLAKQSFTPLVELRECEGETVVDCMRDCARRYAASAGVLTVAALQRQQRVDYFPEILLRLSHDYTRGEGVARTLFFLVTQWDCTPAGTPDVPDAFVGGTFVNLENADGTLGTGRATAMLRILQSTITPLLSTAIAQILVDGAQQKQLTERERELRRQIAHTMNNDILKTRGQLSMRLSSIHQPLTRHAAGSQASSTDVMYHVSDPALSPAAAAWYIASARQQNLHLRAPVPDWVFDLVEGAALGSREQTLRVIAELGDRLRTIELDADRALSRLTNVSRVFARLSEHAFRVPFSSSVTRAGSKLADVIAKSLLTTASTIIQRCRNGHSESRLDGLRRTYGGIHEADVLPELAKLADGAAAISLNDVGPALARLLRRPIEVTIACPDTVWIADDDGVLVASELFSELMNNCIRALRPAPSVTRLTVTVEATARGISRLEWTNTTDADNGTRLRGIAEGGQGLNFVRECLAALRDPSSALHLKTEFVPATSTAVIRAC